MYPLPSHIRSPHLGPREPDPYGIPLAAPPQPRLRAPEPVPLAAVSTPPLHPEAAAHLVHGNVLLSAILAQLRKRRDPGASIAQQAPAPRPPKSTPQLAVNVKTGETFNPSQLRPGEKRVAAEASKRQLRPGEKPLSQGAGARKLPSGREAAYADRRQIRPGEKPMGDKNVRWK